jgi:uncharacterized membrane protein (DUF106 family)
MTTLVARWNRTIGAMLEALLLPFDRLAPIVGVATVSGVVALGVLVIFKATSDQQQIAEVKRRMQAGLFEMRLFNDDLRSILQAQGDILRATCIYLRLSAMPLLWAIVPLVTITAHLQSHYGYHGLNTGGSALLKVQMAPGYELQARSLVLDVPAGLRAETPMVWQPALREAAWRIAADRDGDYVLTVALGQARFAKAIRVSHSVGRRSPMRLAASISDQVFYPAEPPLPANSAVSSISVTYADGYVQIARWKVRWPTPFFVVSVFVAVVLRRRLRVTV